MTAEHPPAPKRAREKASGRYGYEGQWDRLCRCGHTLGVHLAEAPHPCAVADLKDESCDCERFKPAKETAR